MRHKILIDGRFIGVGDSIGRYTLGNLTHLLDIDKENHYSLLIRPAGVRQLRDLGLWEQKNLAIEVLDIPHYSLPEQTRLLIWLNKKPYDLVFFTQFNHPIRYHRPYIITIHDLTTLGYFHRENFLKVAMFKKVMRSAVSDSKKIITISKTTKDELHDYYKIDKQKIEVIYPGIDENYLRIAKMDTTDRKKLGNKFKKVSGIGGEYLLYTGMWKRHKNLTRLLKAFERVKSECRMSNIEKIQLVLAGKIDQREPEVIKEINRVNSKLEIRMSKSETNSKSECRNPKQIGNIAIQQFNNPAVLCTGFIPEELLPAAYCGALAYAQPSLSEGFGLPPLEAMACGTPVVAANISATSEVLGDAALYFDPENVKDMAEKIGKIYSDFKLRLELEKKGFEQIKLYSWRENGKKTLEVIKEVLSNKSN